MNPYDFQAYKYYLDEDESDFEYSDYESGIDYE